MKSHQMIPILTAIAGMFLSNASGAVRLRVVEPILQSSFVGSAPEGWEVQGDWTFGNDGAKSQTSAQATSKQPLPESCMVEMIVALPEPNENTSTSPVAMLRIGQLTSAEPSGKDLVLTIRAANEGYPATLAVGDKKTKPMNVSWLEAASVTELGTEGTVSVLVSLGAGRYRM